MRGVEGRPGQEAHQQSEAGLPGNSSGERRGSDQSKNTLTSPLAANLVRLMEQAQQAIETDNINLRPELSDEELEERQQFFWDIQRAYGIAAYSQFAPRQKNVFREELQQDRRELNIGNVTLSEPQRQVLIQI